MTTATATETRAWGPTHTAMLEFERTRWKQLGARDTAISERFQMLLVEYNATLAWVLEQPQAMEYDPECVTWLRKKRDQRRAARSGARLAGSP